MPLGDVLFGSLLGSWLWAPSPGISESPAFEPFAHHGPTQTRIFSPQPMDRVEAARVPIGALVAFGKERLETRRAEATATFEGQGDLSAWAAAGTSVPQRVLSQLAALALAPAPGSDTVPLGMAPAAGVPTTTQGLAAGVWTSAFEEHRAQPAMVALPQPVTADAAGGPVSAVRPVGSPGKEQAVQNYAKLPLSFEANVGQADSSVQFLAHGSGYGLYLTGTEAVMVLQHGSGVRNQGSGVTGQGSGALTEFPPSQDPLDASRPDSPLLTPDPRPVTPASVVRMQVLGSNPAPQVVAHDQLPGKVNYFLGNDPTKWHTNVSTFARVEYENVYPGINLVYYGHQGQLEYDFVVAPGANPQVIHLGFTGADQVTLDGQGDLVLHAGRQDIVQHKPMVYQDVNGSRQQIASAFVLLDKASGVALAPRQLPALTQPGSPGLARQVGFALGAYDVSRPLVIDPVLSYSTYLGGSNLDWGFGIAVDAAGNAYVTGQTWSTDFPTANPFQTNLKGLYNAFVTKLTADGASLVYSTYLGGSADRGSGIAVDAAGNAYVTGYTFSDNFPTVNPFQSTLKGPFNAFVTKLAADGASLVYSTYLGGTGADSGSGIALDAVGSAYVTGSTSSSNFPTANPFQPNLKGTTNTFVTKLFADGASLVYSTYLGGSAFTGDGGYGIAVDAAGNAYVTGHTTSTNFPTVSSFQANLKGAANAFVTKFAADGASLVYSTYLGGNSNLYWLDSGFGIAVDAAGNAYVTGTTSATNFPTANPFQPSLKGIWNAFVTKLAADGASLVYSTYLGGSNSDAGSGIAVDAAGNAYVTGYTQSTNFPTANPFQPNLKGGPDAFVTKLAADGASLVYSTYLGGSDFDGGYGIAVDGAGNAYVTGRTYSANFPTANPLQPNLSGTGVFKSINGGGNWNTASSGMTNWDLRAFAVDPTSPSTVYAGTGGGGVFKTTNGGANWNASSAGLTNLKVLALAIDPTMTSLLYAATSGGGVFKSSDGGANWTPSNNGLTNLYVSGLVIDPTMPSTLYAATPTFGGGSIFKSTDGGATWNLSNSGLGSAQVVTLAIDPVMPTTLYAATSYGVYKSTNGGGSWSPSNDGLPDGRDILSLAVDPATPTTLYTGIHYEICDEEGHCGNCWSVYKTTNGGVSWSFSSTGLPGSPTLALAIDPATPSTLYAGTGLYGVYKSVNGGGSWSATGLNPNTVQALAIDPATPSTLYAGVFSQPSNAFVTKISA
jgi:photosystem II stability/assembly factor-like uncharacterized protein